MKNLRRLLDASDDVATSSAYATAIFMMADNLPTSQANAFQAVARGLMDSLQKAADSLEAVLPKIGEEN